MDLEFLPLLFPDDLGRSGVDSLNPTTKLSGPGIFFDRKFFNTIQSC